MKELSIEEKAKRYDEAIKKAESLYKAAEPMSGCNVILETIFPELKESEDERIRKWIIGVLSTYEHDRDLRNAAIAWLEKQGEQKPAWSEEDEKMFRAFLSICDVYSTKTSFYSKENDDIEKLKNWLKFLKERVQPQSKQEWSEEDATHYNRILKELNLQKEMPINASVIEEVKSDIIWFKSLRPQNRWKPSDEQMHYLSWIANIKLGDGVVEQEVSKHLNELYEDLLKLKG